MARGNVPLLAFNRGIVSRTALARVDVDRVRLSAEIMKNWVPKTQGPMTIRPGMKYIGSTYNDSGAQFINFIAATDDTALLEFSNNILRVWIDDALLAHNSDTGIDTTISGLSSSDTGSWVSGSSGGVGDTGAITNPDLIPDMTNYTTDGVTISASSENTSYDSNRSQAWRVADDNNQRSWWDTGAGHSALPSWVKVDFGSAKTVRSYSLRAGDESNEIDNAPTTWRLLGSNFDTGSYVNDTGKWTLEASESSETGWSTSERRTYQAQNDTGSTAYQHWQLYVTAVNGDTELAIAELELFDVPPTVPTHMTFSGGTLILNALTRGAVAEAYQQVTCDTGNQNIEHAVAITVDRGPIRFRCGSTQKSDDYVPDTRLLAGEHRLAFTPETDFYLTFYTDEPFDRIISKVAMADTGTLEIDSPYGAADLDNIKWQQSADVVYIAAADKQPRMIERRGTGRSFSLVKYQSNNGPFFDGRTVSGVKLKLDATFGNTTMTASQDFFTPEHEGALFRLFTENYSWEFPLGGEDAFTDPVRISGVTSTTNGEVNDRKYRYTVSGTWSGTLHLVHSTEEEVTGPYTVTRRGNDTGETITGNGLYRKTDRSEAAVNNNLIEYVKIGFQSGDYTSGTAIVSFNDTGKTYGYEGGSATGIARVVAYNSPTSVDVEVVRAPSTTEFTTNWNEGVWSDQQGWPDDVTLFEGRLWWHGRTFTRGSVSDDYESFDDTVEGDSAPVSRTLGEGPVDNIEFALGLSRLLIGTSGAVLSFRASSFDEPLTAENLAIRVASTQGAAPVRAAKIDSRGIYVHRSKTRAYEIFYDLDANDYIARELTLLSPHVLEGVLRTGVADIAVQRQPDTRVHFVLSDGTAVILTYEPPEELVAWSTFETDGSVERITVLPGVEEDQVYYTVKRTINGVEKRYIEKWAKESQATGDTGNAIADSYVETTDTGSTLTGLSHLAGETVCVWRNRLDRGTFTVDTGAGSISGVSGSGNAIVGKTYTADYRSTKLAYAAQGGTALVQPKRVDRIGLILDNTHSKGIKYGSDTGHLDDLPDMLSEGAHTDTGTIFETFDQVSFPFNGDWNTDSRIHLRAQAPRPATCVAAVVSISTKDNL